MSLNFTTPFVLALLLTTTLAQHATAAAPGKEIGIWYDDTAEGAIKIEPCGAKLCGKLVWLKEPLNDKGQPRFDRHNPDESKRKRPICGLPIFGDIQRQSDGSWDSGWVYDPHEGKSYSFSFNLVGTDKLQVTGYLGMKLLGKTMNWTRAPADLPACALPGATQAATTPSVKPATAAAVAPAAKAATAAPSASVAAPGAAAKAPPASSASVKIPSAAATAAPPAANAKATVVKPAAVTATGTEKSANKKSTVSKSANAKPATPKPAPASASGEPLPWAEKQTPPPAPAASSQLGGPWTGR